MGLEARAGSQHKFWQAQKEKDPAPGNNCDNDVVDIPQPPPPPVSDPGVDKVCEPRTITVGQKITCTITVINKSPNAATGATIADTMQDS